MKNIKNLIYLFVFSLMLVSCGEDDVDSVTNFGDTPNLEEVKVSFMDDNLGASIFEGESASYRIGMSKILDGKVEVVLEVTSSDGSVEATYPTPVLIDRGQTVVIFDFMADEDNTAENGEIYTIEIKEINVMYANGSTEYYTFTEDNSRTLSVRDVPTPIVTTTGDVDFNFTWSGNNDLDCRIRDASSNNVDTGYSVTPGETVTLPAGAADGDYTFSVRPWTVNDASITYSIDLVAPTETRNYAGVFENLTGGWSQELITLEINKVTSGATVTYTINQL